MAEKKMIRCFMNGKSCIYERDIDEIIERRASPHEKKSFVMMPFGEQLDVLYQWEIAPFFRNGGQQAGDQRYKCIPERADDVRQVGFVICEKICKKIQEADYVVADLTYDNPNVFYELGLAAALRREIVPICVSDRIPERLQLLERTLGMSKLLPYTCFDILETRIADFVWQLGPEFSDFEQLSGDHVTILHDPRHKVIGKGRYHEEYDFGSFCKTAVGTSVAAIFSEENTQRQPELRLYDESRVRDATRPRSVDLSQRSFRDVIDSCRAAACVLVDVSVESAIANFFWLGYIHGVGGNAIPVNSYQSEPQSNVRSTPFDIRALWHIAFSEDHPGDLLSSLSQILEHIYVRKARYLNRESFWKDILKDNKVSIVLGSLFLDDLGRNTIGDWDYRTAAEITNYLSTSKETMKVTLGSPLPKREANPDKAYIEWLEGQLKDNTIVVASADVNDLTEVALCRILRQTPFRPISEGDKQFKGYIALKKYAKDAEKSFPETAFYIRKKADLDSRGFLIRLGSALDKELMEDFAYPGDPLARGMKRLLGQLIVARNPFAAGKWVVIISGISGPATFGIAQLLTGCMYKEFTVNKLPIDEREQISDFISSYQELATERIPRSIQKDTLDVPYDALSELMLSKLLKISEKTSGEVNALIAVDVYYPARSVSRYSNDERKVIGWKFVDLTEFLGTRWENPNDLQCQM